MATTTPNFGWPVPTSTDLVKDGATAMEALGDAIDTSMVDLKGGTTGQVLAKASATDMDFSWVAQDDSNAIQNSIVDAKGDLIAATANDTPARLAVGANGETLVADNLTSTGLRYQVGNGLAQGVINGGQDIWQRGTSISITNSRKYAVDRFECFTDNAGLAGTISRQTSGLTGIQYCSRVQRTAGNTNTNTIIFNSNLESENSFQYAGQTVTISFYARAGANFSAASNVLAYYLFSGTGSNQNVNSGFTGQATVTSGGSTLTTSWQRFSYTGTVSASATQLAIWFQYTASGTAGANDYFEITGIQLEVGSVATAFRRAGGTIQGELAACQRYYWRRTGENNAQDWFSTFGTAYSTTNATVYFQCPQTMRVKPSAVDYANLMMFRVDNGAQIAVTSLAFNNNNPDMTELIAVGGAFLVNFAVVQIKGDGSGVPFIGFSAEL